MNLVTQWKTKNKEKYNMPYILGNINAICNSKLTSSHISAIERGERNLTACQHWVMLNNSLDGILEKFGIEYPHHLSSEEWIDLIDHLSPPRRKKR